MKLKKEWSDMFRAALRRGLDHGYAAYLADEYMKRKEKAESKEQGEVIKRGRNKV